MVSVASVKTTMSRASAVMRRERPIAPNVPIRVGVDLGTAFTVIMVADESGKPLVGESEFTDVVRDGIVWDFAGAREAVTRLKEKVERRCGRTLTFGAVSIPPDTSNSDHRAHRYVVQGAGIECSEAVDEPTAANKVLGIENGAVVDIGGGTTGIAIIKDGKVVSTMDEPSGGTHLSLVLAGALGIEFAEAEKAKRNSRNHSKFLPIVTPVLEKLATIVKRGVSGYEVEKIHLVGGTSSFTGISEIMTQVTGLPCVVAPHPELVTPLGVTHYAPPITEGMKL